MKNLLLFVFAFVFGQAALASDGQLTWENWGAEAKMEANAGTITGSVWEQCPYGKCNEAPIHFSRRADGTWSGVFGQVAVAASVYAKTDPNKVTFQLNTRPGGVVYYEADLADGNLVLRAHLKTGLSVVATLNGDLTAMRVSIHDNHVQESDVLTRVGGSDNFHYTSRVTDVRGSFYFDGRSTNHGTLSLDNLRKDPALLAIMYALPYGNLMNPLNGMRK